MNKHIPKDRGHKKWTAMYIPKHLEAIRETILAEEHVSIPRLDQQQKNELNYKMNHCLVSRCPTTIQHHSNNRQCTITGILMAVDPGKAQITIQDYQGEQTSILLKHVYSVSTLEDDF